MLSFSEVDEASPDDSVRDLAMVRGATWRLARMGWSLNIACDCR